GGGRLKREGRTIQDVYDRQGALDRLRALPVDVVLAGQGRNGFDGLKLLRQVRSIRPETKVILTGERDPARVIRAIRQRAYSYFHQPLARGGLAHMVQQALDAASWQGDNLVVSAPPRRVPHTVR